MTNRDDMWWHKWFLGMAQYVATASKDPSTKCGAIIIDQSRRIISSGFNGLARGVIDSDERLNNRDIKYKLIIHAERNAMLFAKQDLSGYSLYIWPFMPCASCAAMVIQSGISKVIAPHSNNERWVADFELSQNMFKEANIECSLLNLDI